VPGGAIDPGARQLIEQARAGGWQKWTIDGGGRRPGYTVSFNAAGQFTWDVVLECGLRERVICDGKTLWHLYPEIGVGSRRQVSRFHRAELLAQVPWLLPPVEDLARAADVRLVAKGVVGLVPRGADSALDDEGKPLPFAQVHLVFDPAGRLAERQLVVMP